jgi:hypothetical protein
MDSSISVTQSLILPGLRTAPSQQEGCFASAFALDVVAGWQDGIVRVASAWRSSELISIGIGVDVAFLSMRNSGEVYQLLLFFQASVNKF